MALDRIYYGVHKVATVTYKCLSCGYEERQDLGTD